MNISRAFRRPVAVALIGFVWLSLTACDVLALEGKVRGQVQYEKILYRNPTTGAGGLQLDIPVITPVVGAKVELVDQSGNVLASGTTAAFGYYELTWSSPQPPAAKVRVYAAADNVVVVDHYDPKTIYTVHSDLWMMSEGDSIKDIVATDKGRQSGPFNIIAAIQIGNALVRSAEPAITFPEIKVHWTQRPREGTSFFRNDTKGAYILGYRDEDSDEFDDYVILHEYGHFLSRVFSKDDSPGGDHPRGKLDPRLAWGEGWGNFFACAALNDPRYIDTGRNKYNGSNVLLTFDLDEDRPNGDRVGYWSEHSVGGVLWDLFDSRPGPLHAGLGFADIWKVLRSKAWLERPGYRYLIDFCDLLVEARPDMANRVADALAVRGIQYTPGATPSVANPYVRPLVAGTPHEGEVNTLNQMRVPTNAFDAKAVYSLKLTEKTTVRLHLEILDSKSKDQADIDLFLLGANGRIIKVSDATNGVGGTETIEIELEAGCYFVEVHSWAATNKGMSYNSGAYRLSVHY